MGGLFERIELKWNINEVGPLRYKFKLYANTENKIYTISAIEKATTHNYFTFPIILLGLLLKITYYCRLAMT